MIVHLGLGAFARSHLASYLQDLADPGWPLVGVGLLPGDARVRDGLRRDGLAYPLVLRHPDGTVTTQRIDVLTEYLLAPDDPQAVVERLADPSTRVVSLTITEGGYDARSPAAQADLAGGPPSSAFGLVTAALRRRHARGLEPFTVMSCDNVAHNGAVAREAFAGYARAVDRELGRWVDERAAFPSSMVDRITPATTDADRAAAGHDAVVVAESFRQWALEDDFPLGRPALDRAGVQLVTDVTPYELMKLRLLNGGHQALAYPAALLGHEAVHDAARDPVVRTFLQRWWAEARPTLPPVPGVDLDEYVQLLAERFGNPHVADTVARLCAFTSDRVPLFVLPAVRENLERGRPVQAGAALLATWARYVESATDVVDSRAVPGGEALLEDPALEGIGGDPRVREPFLAALGRLRRGDVPGALGS